MKSATLNRYYQDDKVTLGVFKIDGIDDPIFWTIENAWRDNERNVSCIPSGIYDCVPYSGTQYKDVYMVKNVPDRDAILIHQGNWVKNTQGCILPGLSAGYLKDEKAVVSSTAALNKIKTLLDYEPFILRIIGGDNKWS